MFQAFWTCMHVTALNATDSYRQKNFIRLMHLWANNFPCENPCRVHFKKYLADHPMSFEKMISYWDYFYYTVDFHNAVNLRLGKSTLSRAQAFQMYKDPDFCPSSEFWQGWWIAMHITALKVVELNMETFFVHLLELWSEVLPCPLTYRNNMKYFLSKCKFENYVEDPLYYFYITVDFHNMVNQITHKPILDHAEALAIYAETKMCPNKKIKPASKATMPLKSVKFTSWDF